MSRKAISSAIRLDRTGLRPYEPRTMRILVNPAPITLAERRSILQVLERDGAMEVFRQDTNRAGQYVAVAKNETTASELMAKRYISFDIPRQRSSHPDQFGSREAYSAPSEPHPSERAPPGSRAKTFGIEITPNTWDHHATMQGTPYYSSWNPMLTTGLETFATASLRQALPKGMTSTGLSFWEDRLAETYAVPDPRAIEWDRERVRTLLPSKMIKRDEWAWRRAARILADHGIKPPKNEVDVEAGEGEVESAKGEEVEEQHQEDAWIPAVPELESRTPGPSAYRRPGASILQVGWAKNFIRSNRATGKILETQGPVAVAQSICSRPDALQRIRDRLKAGEKAQKARSSRKPTKQGARDGSSSKGGGDLELVLKDGRRG